MGGVCCCNNAITNGGSDPNLIIDVEKVLKEKAWNTFCIAHGKIERRFLKRKDYEIEVPMNYYNFEVVDRHISGRTPRQEGATGLGRNGGESQLAGKGLAHGDQTSAGHFGLETEFNNDTAQKQTYTFQFEKTRMASIEVNYQRGYSIGTKANFSIGLPKVLGDGSVEFGMDKQIQVTKATGEKFEDSVRTMATSEIVVPPWTRYIASVIMEEQSLLANFTLFLLGALVEKCQTETAAMDARPISGQTGIPPNTGTQQAPRPVGPGVSHPATTVQGEPHQAHGKFTNTTSSTSTATTTARITATVAPWIMAQTPSQSVLTPEYEPITAAMLAALPVQDQKRMLGERICVLIQPKMIRKITGMLLQLDNYRILKALESQVYLKDMVEDATCVLRGQENRLEAAAATKNK